MSWKHLPRRLRTGLAVLLLLLIGWGGIRLILRIAPYAGNEALADLRFSRVYLDRRGGELAILPVDDQGLRRIFVPFEQFPPELEGLVLAAEDSRFRWHAGVDIPSLAAAAAGYFAGGEEVRGASTISMQLSSLLHPRPGTVGGKIREMLDAMQLETRLSKDEILELYINLVPMGFNVEGYPAASRRFYRKKLAQLSVEEMAVLAAVPRSPASFNPVNSLSAAVSSAEGILQAARMNPTHREFSRISAYERPEWPRRAPHFVRYVNARISLQLSGSHVPGITIPRGQIPSHQVPGGGKAGGYGTAARGYEPVITSLDPVLQNELEGVLRSSVEDAADFRIGNAAGLAVDPERGEILAYAGSSDFYDPARQGQVDGVQMLRQPGSTLKPFLYALALESGFTLSTVLPDIPMSFGRREVYVPGNYNNQYNGPVRLRQALSASLNVPAVYLLERLSVGAFSDTLIGLGFESLEEQSGSLGVSLALGGGNVSLYELLQGYLSFHGSGKNRPLVPFLFSESGDRDQAQAQDQDSVRVQDRIQNSDRDEESGRAWEPSTAAMIRDVLSDNDERIMTFGRNSPLKYDLPVMVKTGTSNQFNNIWAVGVAADLAAAVWMGNFSGETVISAPGSSLPAAAVHDIISRHSAGLPFDPPEGLVSREICTLSGEAAGPYCTSTIRELFRFNEVPGECSWHSMGRGGRVETRYPQLYGSWAEDYGYDILLQENAETAIHGAVNHALFFLDAGMPAGNQQLRLYLTGSGEGRLYRDGELLYRGSLPGEVLLMLLPGEHRLELQSGSGTGEFHYSVVR
ncbi:transglycosylase domain-containing protein [Salinispira pacifica]|uniref:peptidoglycan glycosyltransferase n=1 Tax=Salinispira pacifica TaxID=1307761 RepID=V5WF42_9SPIO|nr:transglycosylase domain-containing protein [Salinispira pacifica]AHC14423.1 Multimodular transpeptidase-transglycosylase [Salinispira pacifica]